MKRIHSIATFAATVGVIAAGLIASTAAQAQMAPSANSAGSPSEKTGEKAAPPSPGPINMSWHMTKLDGTGNLLVNSDGTWLFSGQIKDHKAGRDFDISVALKTASGAAVVFNFIGNLQDGVQWSKQGQSDILRDDFKLFAAKHTVAWAYRTPLSAEGRKAAYEAEERKKAAMAKAERAKEEKAQAAAAQAAAQRQQQQAQQSSGGGGTSVGDVLGDIGTGLLSVLSFL